jgi:hypothetical protein
MLTLQTRKATIVRPQYSATVSHHNYWVYIKGDSKLKYFPNCQCVTEDLMQNSKWKLFNEIVGSILTTVHGQLKMKEHWYNPSKTLLTVHITVLKGLVCYILCLLKEGMVLFKLFSLLLFFKMFMFWGTEFHPWFSLLRENNRKYNTPFSLGHFHGPSILTHWKNLIKKFMCTIHYTQRMKVQKHGATSYII